MPAALPSTPGARPSSSASQYRPPSRAQSKDERSAPKEDVTRALQDYQLGDLLGKGASGAVYRALNFTTGETVAIKQIQLANIPKAELGEIMSEINLLKNLNHPNIVKYKGYVKSKDFLHIVLEYCENGSLHSICKRFGKFPEHLVGQFIYQTLQGLNYLHEQGVIHRDIKGANILTIKDGRVKLADFGVATISVNLTGSEGEGRDLSVVGSPYWMAPEIIEQAGASTASDIWSVGCVVIELVSGKPPYYALEPMQALFRIVQDDTPPIPPGLSETVQDFLLATFQKDPALRVGAHRLMKHPWMLAARKQLDSRQLDYEEGVERVQKFNEQLQKTAYVPPSQLSHGKASPRSRTSAPQASGSTFPALHPAGPSPAALTGTSTLLHDRRQSGSRAQPVFSPAKPLPASLPQLARQDTDDESDNWDSDFEEGVSLSKLKPKGPAAPLALPASNDVEPRSHDWNMRTIMPGRSSASPVEALPSTFWNRGGKLAGSTAAHVAQTPDITYDQDAIRDHGFPFASALSPPANGHSSAAAKLQSSPINAIAPLPSPPPSTPRFASLRVTSGSSPSILDNLRPPNGGIRRASERLPRAEAVYARDLRQYAEGAEDYDDIFDDKPSVDVGRISSLKLETRLSEKSWLGDEDLDEEDPFAAIDESFGRDEVDSDVALDRDKNARLAAILSELVDELQPSASNSVLRDVGDQLLNIISDVPEMGELFISRHGVLAILEVLEWKPSREVILRLLRVVNLIVISNLDLLESFCLVGGIPIVIAFTLKQYSPECRLEAAIFISALCNASAQTLQMFISCRGLRVLVELLDEDYNCDKELVISALGGIGSVLQLQSATPRADFCRVLIREGLEDPLSAAVLNVTRDRDQGAEEAKTQVLAVLLLFCQVSQSDQRIQTALGKRRIMKRLVSACDGLHPTHLIVLLRSIKHLSTSPVNLNVLQNVNAIEVLADLLGTYRTGTHGTEVCNHVLQTLFNLCRLNKGRQEETAQSGIIPHLRELVTSRSPLRQFALPILFDFASASKGSRTILWKTDVYLDLTSDPYWQGSALDSALVWLQEETARVEDVLIENWATERLASCFVEAKTVSFDTLLERYLRLFRLSPAVASKVATPAFFRRLVDRLSRTTRPVVRLNLLKLARVVVESQPDKAGLLRRCGGSEVVDRLAQQDDAVLVRELAKELARELKMPISAGDKPDGRPKSTLRRAASESSTTVRSDTRAPPAPPLPPMPPKHVLAPRRPLQPASPVGGQRPPTPTHKRKTSRALAEIRWVEGRDGQIKPKTSARQTS